MASDGTVQDERGDPLTDPDSIDPETALEIVDALAQVLDGGDWWRLKRALYSRAKDRSGEYEYTKQDWNLAEKIKRIDEVREMRAEYEELSEVFDSDAE